MNSVDVLKEMKWIRDNRLNLLSKSEKETWKKAVLALERQEKVKQISSDRIYVLEARIEEIEEEVLRQMKGRKPKLTNDKIDEVEILRGSVRTWREVRGLIE